jgi:hypothetical protein
MKERGEMKTKRSRNIQEEEDMTHLICAEETTGLAFKMYGARGIKR